jgi:hypothetical protein
MLIMTETAAQQAGALIRKHAQELRDTWQARLLAKAEGKEFAVALAIIALEWPTAVPMLLRTVFPGFTDITRPFLTGYASVQIDGSLYCAVIERDYSWNYIRLYNTEIEMTAAFRIIADNLKLDDADRTMMFDILRKWVTSDMRVDEYGRRKLH